MGGANEQIVSQSKSKEQQVVVQQAPETETIDVGLGTAPQMPEVLNDIRIHHSGGNTHFHDDTNKLKVAVPIADAWAGWATAQRTGYCRLIDTSRQTVADIEVIGKDSLLAKINIRKIRIHESFNAINKALAHV